MWGRRYLVVLLVRPIPRSLWPTKYADAARFLNIPSIDHIEKDPQLTDFTSTVGWTGAVGSAPGGIFDLWIEFWVGVLIRRLRGRVGLWPWPTAKRCRKTASGRRCMPS